MTTIDKLASSLGRKDENPNIELANQIVSDSDKSAVKELLENLDNKSKDIRHDCIKTLYEIGSKAPSLIVDYTDNFIQLLKSKDNRMQWGAMTALNHLTNENPKKVYLALSQLAHVADTGSVITKDNYVAILIKLCAVKEFADNAFVLLNEQLLRSPANQLPMYAENALSIISPENKVVFIKTLSSRLDDFEKESKRKRVEKVLKKIQNK